MNKEELQQRLDEFIKTVALTTEIEDKDKTYIINRCTEIVKRLKKNQAAVALGKKSAEARKGKTDYSALAKKRWSKKS